MITKLVRGAFIALGVVALGIAGARRLPALLALDGELRSPIRYYGDSSDLEETR
jgi:hypothetical protein